jgi:hypothetical protein
VMPVEIRPAAEGDQGAGKAMVRASAVNPRDIHRLRR